MKENKWVEKEQIEQAKSIDLLSYLQMTDPYNLKRVSASTYCLRTHDSFTITTKYWRWWSTGIGGKNALDYLTRVMGMKFNEAVIELTGDPSRYESRVIANKQLAVEDTERHLVLPSKCRSSDYLIKYLRKRGIADNVISDFIRRGDIYEDDRFHNVVFVGRDEEGIPRYGAVRSTGYSREYKGDCEGSDKRYSFKSICEGAKEVHVFEAAIDLMSYATLMGLLADKDYRDTNLLSLSGIYQSGNGGTTMPKALDTFLESHQYVEKVYLHLDNDNPGRRATLDIAKLLERNCYSVYDKPVPYGKDVNDFLMYIRQEGLTEHNKDIWIK